MTETRSTTLWVCYDCMATDVNGEASDDPDSTPDREPWSLWSTEDSSTVYLGLIDSEHAEDCPRREGDKMYLDCSCEEMDFSWSACEGCGSTLGGSRHAFTYFVRQSVQENLDTLAAIT
jgi:hypothetical protein